jgi:hypothetical protein
MHFSIVRGHDRRFTLAGLVTLACVGCSTTQVEQSVGSIESTEGPAAALLVIDEDSIDNGNPPNYFSDVDVNDQMAEVGVREELRYFRLNPGKVIDLFTGQIEDEGWFSLQTIPAEWNGAGPTNDGALNFWVAGPGLGSSGNGLDREDLLDKVPDVTPLREAELMALVGAHVCAVVYDSDVSINYSPLNGSLKGANLGTVSFEVLSAAKRTDGSSSSLPRMTIRILSEDTCTAICVSGACGDPGGAPCTAHSECWSNVCVQNSCAGAAEGARCRTAADCQSGLACVAPDPGGAVCSLVVIE